MLRFAQVARTAAAQRRAMSTGVVRHEATLRGQLARPGAHHTPDAELYLGEIGTWPMFAILGLAGVIVTFTLTRNMAKSPDFYADPSKRGSVLRHSPEVGESWRKDRQRLRGNTTVDKICIFPTLNHGK